MIFWKLIETDQSYELSCHDKNFVQCPIRFSCPGDRENKSVRENRRVKMFAVAGYHAVVCDVFIRPHIHEARKIDGESLSL